MVLPGGQPSGESGISGEAPANCAVTKATSVTQLDTHFMQVPQPAGDGVERPTLTRPERTLAPNAAISPVIILKGA